jgi:hypothetical protein
MTQEKTSSQVAQVTIFGLPVFIDEDHEFVGPDEIVLTDFRTWKARFVLRCEDETENGQ